MEAVSETTRLETTRPRIEGYPISSIRFDWIAALISSWLIGGLFLDGWAHNHGRVDDTFFTPWHAVLYSGAAALIAFLAVSQWRNINKGHQWRFALPLGYMPSLVGAVLFVVGGGFDLIWHTLFGLEVNIETLLSPTHLVLASSGALMITGPVRSAWNAYNAGQSWGWRKLGPAVLCMALLLSVLTFFTNFANPVTRMADSFSQSTLLDVAWFSDLYIMNADGSGQTRLSHPTGFTAWSGDWSPDGNQVVVSLTETSTLNTPESNSALYIMNADGSEARQLTDMAGSEYLPSWSPDGKTIAFVGQNGDNTAVIYTINSDGGDIKTLTDGTSAVYMPVWSPDSQQILFTSNPTGTDYLYVMNADGGDVREVVNQGLYNWGAHWSPDGKQIVFNSYRDDNTDLYSINADGTGETRLTTNPANELMPSWSPDGEYIVFSSTQDEVTDIYRIKPDGSDLTNISNNPALVNQYPVWSPDGSKILYTSNPYSNQTNGYDREATGVVSVLLQAALMAGVVLLIVRRWLLPLGSLTLIFTLNTALMAVLNDHYMLIIPALIAGLIGDGLMAYLKPSVVAGVRYYGFAFAFPAVYYALFFLTIQLTQGIDWTIHLWLGAIVMAGIVGALIAILVALQNPPVAHAN
jgi:Tol biopolymer transport system component